MSPIWVLWPAVPPFTGNRINGFQLEEKVEELGTAPQIVAHSYDPTMATVNLVLAFGHDHPRDRYIRLSVAK